MKQKTDEMPDEWIRQTLSKLPDTPPPGSSFDSEHLWSQLRPELKATPVRKRWGWWLAAAAVATGVLMLWVSVYRQKTTSKAHISVKQQVNKEEQAIAQVATPSVDTGTRVKSMSGLKGKAGSPKKVTNKRVNPEEITTNNLVNEPHEVIVNVHLSRPEVNTPRERGIPIPGTLGATFPEQQPVQNVAVITDKLPEKQKPNVANTTSKRRFKIVHENELRAEEESAPQIYRTDNFVRLGTGQRNDNATDTHQPGLVMPLTSKSNQ